MPLDPSADPPNKTLFLVLTYTGPCCCYKVKTGVNSPSKWITSSAVAQQALARPPTEYHSLVLTLDTFIACLLPETGLRTIFRQFSTGGIDWWNPSIIAGESCPTVGSERCFQLGSHHESVLFFQPRFYMICMSSLFLVLTAEARMHIVFLNVASCLYAAFITHAPSVFAFVLVRLLSITIDRSIKMFTCHRPEKYANTLLGGI